MATGAWSHNFPTSKDTHPAYIDYPIAGWDTIIAAFFHDIFTALDAIQDTLGYDVRGGFTDLKDRLDASGIVDRGDPADSDWIDTDLTFDGNWHDLDTSGKIPSGMACCILHVELDDVVAASRLDFRKKGNSNIRNIAAISTHVANIKSWANFIVLLDGMGKFQYRSHGTNTPVVDITICGGGT